MERTRATSAADGAASPRDPGRLEVHPADGSKPIHISPMLTGLQGLAAAALAGISKKALAHDSSVRGVLLMMRHGRAARLVLDPGPDAATVAELEALSTRDAS